MGDIIGLGISHWPRLAKVDSELTIRLKLSLRDPHIPEELKRVSAWPEAMQREWGDDEGLTAAPKHRAEMLEGIRKVRATLDAFRPDAVVVWGDDQYENFRDDIIPPFCVLAYDGPIETKPYAESRMEGSAAANVWNRPHDEPYTVTFAPDVAKALVSGLLSESFDVAYAYRPLHFPTLSHAFLNAVLYLDYDRVGFPYPIVPFTVNCYGKFVVSHRGTQLSKVKEERFLDPPSPSPQRCFDIGAATARVLRQSPYRIALLASSSWSHAFLCTKNFQLRPDNASDRRLYAALVAGDFAAWRATPLADVVDAGQQEMLNWFCLMGAMSELNGKLTWSQFVETAIFNSDKVAAIYEPVLAGGPGRAVSPEFPPFDRNPRPPRRAAPPSSCDTHMHVYGDPARYPAQKTNHLYATPDARLADYLTMRRTIGFTRSVFVQPTVYGTDHSFFKDTLRAIGTSENFRGVALVDDTLGDRDLEELHGLGVRCARFIFRANLGMRPSLESFRRSLARIKELGWFVKIFGMAQDAVDLADELRKIEVTAVIDHMWRLIPGDPVSLRAFDLVRELLQSENWWVQLSNGDRSSLQPAGWSDVVPFGRALYEAAPDRCIWGTDWPHAEYRKPSVPNDGALVDLLADYLPDEPARTKVFVTNPARLFGFSA